MHSAELGDLSPLDNAQCRFVCAAAEEAEAERSSAEARSKGGLEDLLVFRETDVHTPIPEPQNLNEVLDEGVSRLQDKSTWKVWQWPNGGPEFYDAESFRCFDIILCRLMLIIQRARPAVC